MQPLTRGPHVLILVFPLVLTGCGSTGDSDRARAHGSKTPAFALDVAPILRSQCLYCHRPAGPAPFSLHTYEEVKARADLVLAAIESGRMPPWLPASGCADFAGERRLDGAAIATIRRWVRAGMPPGDTSRLAGSSASSPGWPLGEPDLVIEMQEPYVLRPAERDIFRNFVIPVPVDSSHYVRAIDLRPGSRGVVHHATLMIDETESSRQADAADPGPGFGGMFTRTQARAPRGYFLGWTPGKVPSRGYPDMSWPLEPGTDLVLQLHLPPVARPETVQARVGFYFADQPPRRFPGLVRLGSQTIDIRPGESDYVIRDSYTLPVDVEVLSVYPHAHYLAEEMHGYATLPDGSERCLIRIPDWDFNWQDEYRFAEPIELPAGTRLHMRYTYDNSSGNPDNPHDPPRRVVYGPSSTDEMGDLWIQVVADDREALEELNRDSWHKDLLAQMEGFEQLVRFNPDDASAHRALGSTYWMLGRAEDAIAQYRSSLEIDPDVAATHFALGLVLEAQGHREEASRHYEETVRLDPTNGLARLRLGESLVARGELDEAVSHLQQGVKLRPRDARAHFDLGKALRARGRIDAAVERLREAVRLDSTMAVAHNLLAGALWERGRVADAFRHYRKALEIDDRFIAAHNDLGNLLVTVGELEEGIDHYLKALEIDPGYERARQNLEGALRKVTARAWTLATHPDAGRRDPDEAVRLAERAARLTHDQNPFVLDVLGAAYASAGRYDRAIRTAERAVALAAAAGADRVARLIRERLSLYRRGQPFVDPGPDASE